MFKSKKKQEKENKKSEGASSSYNETTHVQTKNGTTIFTRQVSSQSSQFKSTNERTVTMQHSSSTGAVPRLLANSSLQGGTDHWGFGTGLTSSLQSDANRWTLGTGSASNSPLSSRLPTTSLSSTFGTSTQPRLSLPTSSRSPALTSSYRSAFSSNPTGSYPSRSRPPPFVSSLSTPNAPVAQSQTSVQPVPIRSEHVIPTYPINNKKRGRALIINNIKFIDVKAERVGAEKDAKDMSKLLEMIGFEVDIKKNLKGKEMLEKVSKFSQTNFSNHDISMIVVMSHGNNVNTKDGTGKFARVQGGYTEIAGVDNDTLLVDDIIEKFTTSKSHSSLKGKPKIFIFQCCRGENDQQIAHDTVPIKRVIKEHSDMLIAFSTLPGYLSNRDPQTGTWYIQSICEVFERHYKDFHIEEMLKIVDDKLSTKHPRYTQTSTYESRGFKRCFLYPPTSQ